MSTFSCHHNHLSKHTSAPGSCGGLIFGLLVTGVGLLFFFDHLDMLGGLNAIQFWPGIFVVWGLFRLLRPQRRGERLWGILTASIAAVGLLHTLGVVTLPWNLVWPALIAVMGIFIVIRVALLRRTRPALKESFELADDQFSKVVMGEKEERFDHVPFTGGAIEVLMGSYYLDLHKAQIESEASLLVKATMGEVTVRVPSKANVVVEGDQILGTIENTASGGHPGRPTLRIHAHITLGTLTVEQ